MRRQQTVVIVSGAARGIGAAEALALVEHRARVVIGDLLDDLGRTLASELNAGRLNACAQYLHLDATRMEDWEHAVRLAEASFGRLTTLVNNVERPTKGKVQTCRRTRQPGRKTQHDRSCCSD